MTGREIIPPTGARTTVPIAARSTTPAKCYRGVRKSGAARTATLSGLAISLALAGLYLSLIAGDASETYLRSVVAGSGLTGLVLWPVGLLWTLDDDSLPRRRRQMHLLTIALALHGAVALAVLMWLDRTS